MISLWYKVKNAGLVDGVCKACAGKTGAREAAVEQGLALLDELAAIHPWPATEMKGSKS